MPPRPLSVLTCTAVTSASDVDVDEDEAKEQHDSKVVNREEEEVSYCYEEALGLRRGMAVHNPPPLPPHSPKSTSTTALLFTQPVNDERLEGGIAWAQVSCTPSGSSL